LNQTWTLIADLVLTGSLVNLGNLAHIYALIHGDQLLGNLAPIYAVIYRDQFLEHLVVKPVQG